jgi:hypothetical protein
LSTYKDFRLRPNGRRMASFLIKANNLVGKHLALRKLEPGSSEGSSQPVGIQQHPRSGYANSTVNKPRKTYYEYLVEGKLPPHVRLRLSTIQRWSRKQNTHMKRQCRFTSLQSIADYRIELPDKSLSFDMNLLHVEGMRRAFPNQHADSAVIGYLYGNESNVTLDVVFSIVQRDQRLSSVTHLMMWNSSQSRYYIVSRK